MLSTLKYCSKRVLAPKSIKRAIKNEPVETYSTVPKGHKIKQKQSNEDYLDYCLGLAYSTAVSSLGLYTFDA